MSAHTRHRHETEPEDVDARAAEWLIARAGAGWTEQSQQSLDAWLAAAPGHRAAYAHAERTWALLGELRDAPELLPDPMPALMPAPPARPRRHAWALMGVAALATVLVLRWTDGDPATAWAADHRTAVGETREVALADGSRVKLGASSAIAIHFDQQERRLELLRGEALFEAAPVRAGVEPRPFVVAAAQGSTRALGTRFVVETSASQTLVTGVEHQIAVSVDTGSAVLSPGQAVRYDGHGLGTVENVGTDRATAWMRGVLVFDRLPLAEVVARLNRYHGGYIVVRGDALAQRTVSGVFPSGDVSGALQSIVDELDARSLRLPGVTVLY